MTRLTHMPTASLSRDPYPHNTTAHQSRLSDMFSRLQPTPSSRMHDYTINALRDSHLYPLNTPSHPSHSVVAHSRWISSAAGQRRYDPLGVQESWDASNNQKSLACTSNEDISEPPMYYFPDEDDALEGENNIGQLGIEYDEAAVAETMAERRKRMGSEGIRTAVTITSVSSRQSSEHSSPRIKLLKAQPQKLHADPKTCHLEGSSTYLSPRALASQTASRQPTPNADLPGPAESSGYNKQKENTSPAVMNKVWTSCFDTVPTIDYPTEGPEPTIVLAMGKSAESDQYIEVDHCMDSAAAMNERNATASGKTKSTATLEIEPVGRSSKQASAAIVELIIQKKSKEPNGAFAKPAPATTQARPPRDPHQMVVTEVPRATPPCDDASVRRSRRTRLPPLDYWKNERALYELSKTTPDAGRVIKGVIRPSEESFEEVEMPPRKKQSTASTQTDSQSKSAPSKIKDTEDSTDSCRTDDEQKSIAQSGFNEEPRTEGQVVDPTTGTVIFRGLAENKDTMSRFKVMPKSGYKHHMGLACGELSSGVMKIEPDREKPKRLAHAGTIFYVTKGRVAVTVNNSTFSVTTGGQFMVTRGNQYSIKNFGREDSIIFYARVKAHDAESVPAPGERKDGKKTKRNAECCVKESKLGNTKQLPPPSPGPSPEISSQSSPEPVAVTSLSIKKIAHLQK
ncbi:Centromere protein C [Podila epicladia]|nr:Centromere protein C [Podila epicladia]